jgi:hypothetical protein
MQEKMKKSYKYRFKHKHQKICTSLKIVDGK